MIEFKQHKKFKRDIAKVTFSDSQFNKYIKYLHLLANNQTLELIRIGTHNQLFKNK